MVQDLIKLFIEGAFESNEPLTVFIVAITVVVSAFLILWFNRKLMSAILQDLNIISKVISLIIVVPTSLYMSSDVLEELSGFIVAATFALFALGMTNHLIREQTKDVK